jgi:hypothetical protein
VVISDSKKEDLSMTNTATKSEQKAANPTNDGPNTFTLLQIKTPPNSTGPLLGAQTAHFKVLDHWIATARRLGISAELISSAENANSTK